MADAQELRAKTVSIDLNTKLGPRHVEGSLRRNDRHVHGAIATVELVEECVELIVVHLADVFASDNHVALNLVT